MQKNHSIFDYTITLTRKFRYLVVGSPEFGIQISSGYVDLNELSPEAIGKAVLKVLGQIDSQAHALQSEGKSLPRPRPNMSRDWMATAEAARALGISAPTLRSMVRKGILRAERTMGGHLRFSIEALSEHLALHELNSRRPMIQMGPAPGAAAEDLGATLRAA